MSTWSGFVYVALVIDSFSRVVVGWQVPKVKDTAMVTAAVKMALWRRDHSGHRVGDGLINNSDAGSLYTSIAFAETLVLRDPAPLFRTNVEGLRHVLGAAVAARLSKFLFTSTTGTLAISATKPVTEDDEHNWNDGGAYIQSRVVAEQLVMQYVREKGLAAVALCVSTTYGPGDWQPTHRTDRLLRGSPKVCFRSIPTSAVKW